MSIYDDLKANARKCIGIPYVYGGTTTSGLDCSGLCQYVYKQCGINIPRTTWDQINAGTKIYNKSELKTGDLIFNSASNPTHVFMYMENGYVIEAKRTGTLISEHNQWTWCGIAVRIIKDGNASIDKTIRFTGTVNTSNLNVRSGPSTNYSIIGAYSLNQTVNIISQESNDWYKVLYNGTIGYVSNAYVSNVKAVGETSTPAPDNNKPQEDLTVKFTGRVNTSNLNVRSGPSTSYSILGAYSLNQTVNIISQESNGWYKIKYGTGIGYVSNAYVSDVTAVGGNQQEVIKYKGVVNASALNVRSGAGTNYSVLGSLSRNQTVEIYSEAGEWYKIKYGTGVGYVSKAYVINVQPV